ncbi:TetR family transcriptional regulator [Hoeflea marina]|uniref:TetR family transcriptional regulator n=1 Tax=Hoeflea marina TaxID=274592 RepID=A0A317PYM9_9HYPH|nr:TetR/AcrR family transcriptional regulator [Hoeflea marina]PWW04610.1 TetR family transcriptional regulator [Hoeflea marina]
MTDLSSPAPTRERPRRRAPSRRALATNAAILDAAERLFAERGYEGASVRDIASAAGAQIASVGFHHGSKAELFSRVVERRAAHLSDLRLKALTDLRAAPAPPTLGALLSAFLRPYLGLAGGGDPQWLAYARLVAMVSADQRWHAISERCFDPTVAEFLAEVAALFPKAEPRAISTAFVFSVAAMLSLSTSQWRIEALAPRTGSGAGAAQGASMEILADDLVRFCEAGMRAALEG